MVLKRVRVPLKIGDTMRVLCCLLLGWSVLLSGCGESQEDASVPVKPDEKPQAANESKEDALAAIKKLGGRVTFDEKSPGKPLVGVDFHNSKRADAEVEQVKGRMRLQDLTPKWTRVTDAELVHLKGLTSLKSLNLSRTRVSDAGLVHLNGLTSLQSLSFENTQVTDGGVKDLQAALPKCKIIK